MLTPVTTHATGDVFPAADWNTYLRDNMNWLIVSGGALASAAVITVTNEYHSITGSTTIQTITYAGAVAGQQLRLQFAGGCPIDGHSGNIRLLTGDRTTLTKEIVTLTYDGTNWTEAGGGRLISADTKNAAVSTSGTTFGTGADLLASARSFYADGVGTYLVTVLSPGWRNSIAAGANSLMLNLDGANAGTMTQANFATASFDYGLACAVTILPAIGVHTVNARLVSSSGGGTATIDAGASGAGAYVPAILKVERVG